MGKKNGSTEDDSFAESPTKKHKKHKKHKHKRKKDHEPEVDVVGTSSQDDGNHGVQSRHEYESQPAIKLKIKFGGHDLGTKSVTKADVHEKCTVVPSWQSSLPDEDALKPKKSVEETSDEEQKWLDALERGDLDDNGEVKRETDTSLLTTRQKALLHGMRNETLLELPTGYKNAELTEEQLQRRKIRAKKRREQAIQKREKEKKQTLERLLKKQDCKGKSSKGKGKRSHAPSFRYCNSQSRVTISVPQGYPFPLATQTASEAPKPVPCGVVGCTNFKKYCCSKTGVPLCSLECYRRNLKYHGK